jgi:putative transposase
MSNKFQDKYRISTTRLQNWDYSWNALYFVTICTKNREHYFGKIENDKMVLSNIGVMADVFWHEIKNHCQFVDLDAFVVMPNHIHGILAINNPTHNSDFVGDSVETRHALSHKSQTSTIQPESTNFSKSVGQKRFQNQGKNTLSSILGSYKSAVTKHAHRLGHEFEWQTRFHDHIIRDALSFQRIRNYIETNILNWDSDKFNDRIPS